MSLEEFEKFIKKIQSNPSFKAAAIRSVNLISYNNQNSPPEKQLNICKEIILTASVVIYTQKNFFLLDALNEKLSSIKATGLIDFWQSQTIDNKLSKSGTSKGNQKLGFKHLKAVFVILCGGWLVGILVLAVEVLMKL
jgi:hypothetical protein